MATGVDQGPRFQCLRTPRSEINHTLRGYRLGHATKRVERAPGRRAPGPAAHLSRSGTGAAALRFPAVLWRTVERLRPPGSVAPGSGAARCAAVADLHLRCGAAGHPAIVIVTGLLDYIAYGPQFGQAFPPTWAGCACRSSTGRPGRPGCSSSPGPTRRAGAGVIPLVLAKLWSWCPAVRLAAGALAGQVLERLSLLAWSAGSCSSWPPAC